MSELEIKTLQNRINDLKRLLPLYQKQITEICELKGQLDNQRQHYKEELEKKDTELREVTRDRNRLLKKLSEV